MKILVVTGGHLPIPAVKGGAVETLIESYLDENEIKYHDEIDVISVKPDNIKGKLKNYKYTNFIYLKNKTKNSIYNIWYRLNRKLNHYIGDYFLKSSIKIIKKNKKNYDLILCENEPQYTILLKKYFKTKIFLHLHNDTLNPQCKFYKKMIQSCDKILAISNFIKKRVDCSKKCVIVYNGIDFRLFDKKEAFNNDLKNKYNIKKDDFVFSFVGRVVPDKGVAELISAFEQLNKKYKNIKLFIIGSPNMAHKVTRNYYYNLTNKPYKNVIFTGYVDNNKIKNYSSFVDVQIIPSIFDEPFGLVAIEALALNKRIIVTDSGALPEIVDKKFGIIVKRKNLVNNLCKAMEEEYLHPKRNKNCISELQMYSKENYAERLHDSLK